MTCAPATNTLLKEDECGIPFLIFFFQPSHPNAAAAAFQTREEDGKNEIICFHFGVLPVLRILTPASITSTERMFYHVNCNRNTPVYLYSDSDFLRQSKAESPESQRCFLAKGTSG
jgi:hypothetical protein